MAENSPEKNKDYGLPKVNPQPIQRDQPVGAKNPPKPPPPVQKKKDQRPVIIALLVVGLLVLASVLYMIFSNDEPDDSVQTIEPVEDRVVMDPDESEGENSENNAETDIDPQLNEEPGSIITISERTNRYYIFVGSYKFRAYARRHADKLAADGFAVKLITPDNWVGMRVAVGNYASEDEAGNDAQEIRNRYGNEVVISKY
ncbi:MAG: hypothetical protein DHS20C17_29430 [Cyclobacteriaceae bacterium]|nr:MAG: hypothetical protein DHS20C17_29430 [Cyclobacteriaceae bacterium]